MKFKTLLLGSAAAMVLAGGAQAADLTVAEPVDYVKVCDAFGAGFFYSPGTDTCIKIGGYVKFGTNVNNNNSYNGTFTLVGAGTGENGGFIGTANRRDGDTHYGQFYTEASIQLTASSVTEYGNLTGWIDLRADTGSQYTYAASGDAFGHIDSAYIELGPLKAGHFTSAFDYLGGYTDFGAFRADQSTDHIQLTYALGGFGIIASVEDGSDRLNPYNTAGFGYSGSFTNPGTGAGAANTYTTNYTYTGANKKSSPDLVAALTYATGPFSAKLSGAYVNAGAAKIGEGTGGGFGAGVPITGGGYAYTQTINYDISTKSGYAVQLGLEVALDNISKGDKFGIQGVYANDAPAYTGWQKFYGAQTALWDGKIYGGFASYIHYWNPSLWTALEGSYLHHSDSDNGVGTANLWQVSASTDWSVVKNLDIMLDGSYAHTSNILFDNGDAHQWSVNLWMKRSW